MNKPFNLHIKLKEFGTFIDIIIGNEQENIEFCKKRYKKSDTESIKMVETFIKENAGGMLDLNDNDGSKAWLIFLNNIDCKTNIERTLVHELNHAITGIDKYYQINSEEFISYYLGYYTEFVLKEYKKCLKSE